MAAGSQGFSLAQGAFIGKYRVLDPLGHNALGEAYLVRSNQTRRTGVLTVVDPAQARPGLVEELQALSGLENPAIARIEPPEEDRGRILIPAEFVEGIGGGQVTLADELAKSGGKLSDELVEPLLRSLAGALAYAHNYRGSGICHGSLSPQTIALTKQAHPRLLDFGFSALAGEGSVAGDLQALGRVMAALTGGKGRWQSLAERCRAAGTPTGFASVRELIEAFDQVEASRGRRGLAALVVILVVVAVGIGTGVAFLLKGDTKKAPETVAAQPTTPAVPAADLAQIETNLAAAERAIAKAQPDLARRFLDKVFAVDPKNARANKLSGDLDTEAGMARVGVVKEKADRLWGKVRQLDAVPAFAPQLAAVGEQYKHALSAYTGMDFDGAESRYGTFVTAAEALLALEAVRQDALRLKNEVEDAYDAAEDQQAVTFAKPDWERGLAQREAGKEAFEKDDYPAAKAAREEAVQVFKDAARRAAGRAKVGVAKKTYDMVNDYADTELLATIPKDKRDRLARLATEAATLCEQEKFAESVTAWDQARTELDAALKEAAKEAGEKAPTIAARGERSKGELAINGTLEAGEGGQPEGWSILDGLTGKWSKQGHPGRCLELDTSVLQVDKERFLKEIGVAEELGKNQNMTRAPTKPGAAEDFERSKGGQYETVGAHEGVWAFAAPVAVAPGDQYFVIEVDCLGPAKSTPLFYPQVFIRGFQKFDPKKDAGRSSWFYVPHPNGPAFSEQFGTDDQRRRARLGDYLMVYRHSLVCRNQAANIWEHYRMAFKLPDEERFRPEVLLMKAYAMWPLGVYRFDNLKLRSTDEAEFKEISKQGHSIKGFMPTE